MAKTRQKKTGDPESPRALFYPATTTTEGEEHVVRFVDFPEALTSGKSVEEALDQAHDCLAEAVAARIADGEKLPLPSPVLSGCHIISVPRPDVGI